MQKYIIYDTEPKDYQPGILTLYRQAAEGNAELIQFLDFFQPFITILASLRHDYYYRDNQSKYEKLYQWVKQYPEYLSFSVDMIGQFNIGGNFEVAVALTNDLEFYKKVMALSGMSNYTMMQYREETNTLPVDVLAFLLRYKNTEHDKTYWSFLKELSDEELELLVPQIAKKVNGYSHVALRNAVYGGVRAFRILFFSHPFSTYSIKEAIESALSNRKFDVVEFLYENQPQLFSIEMLYEKVRYGFNENDHWFSQIGLLHWLQSHPHLLKELTAYCILQDNVEIAKRLNMYEENV